MRDICEGISDAKDRAHVPDKLEGYLLQTRHALFDLISFDHNRIVSVEAYDDVATENENLVAAQKLNTGTIAQAFHNAADINQAKAALKAAKLEICGDSKAPKEVSDSLKPYIVYCFSKENESVVLDVIKRISVELHSGDYDKKLSETMASWESE